MKKTVFNNKSFHTLLLIGLGLLSCFNLYTYSISQNLIALIPAIVQIVLLILILLKNKHAKVGVKIWSILLIVTPILSLLLDTIQVLLGDDILNKIGPAIFQILMLLVGLTVYHYNNTTVEVKTID